MTLDYEQFADIILRSPGSYEIRETRADGHRQIYRGHDVSAFFSRSDSRQHSHEVYDTSGTLVYSRDANGFVRVGDAGQHLRAEKRRSVGSILLWGLRGKPDNVGRKMVSDAVRWNLGGKRR